LLLNLVPNYALCGPKEMANTTVLAIVGGLEPGWRDTWFVFPPLVDLPVSKDI
jgi:hypothetical protein